MEYLKQLGARPEDMRGVDRERASALINELKDLRRQGEPATEKQMSYLKRLGAPERQVAKVRTKAEAARLIEEMHLSPTPAQLSLLREMGASGSQVAALKSRAAAAALIDALSPK
jgi:hypothetical protein